MFKTCTQWENLEVAEYWGEMAAGGVSQNLDV